MVMGVMLDPLLILSGLQPFLRAQPSLALWGGMTGGRGVTG